MPKEREAGTAEEVVERIFDNAIKNDRFSKEFMLIEISKLIRQARREAWEQGRETVVKLIASFGNTSADMRLISLAKKLPNPHSKSEGKS